MKNLCIWEVLYKEDNSYNRGAHKAEFVKEFGVEDNPYLYPSAFSLYDNYYTIAVLAYTIHEAIERAETYLEEMMT